MDIVAEVIELMSRDEPVDDLIQQFDEYDKDRFFKETGIALRTR